MDPFTLHLALGCLLTFSHADRAMTEADGEVPDGVVYRSVTLTDPHGHHHVLERGGAGEGFSPGGLFKAGKSPDGLYASYLTFAEGATANSNAVRFVSARACAPVRFLNLRDGADVEAGRYQGWHAGSAHTVRVLVKANQYEPALPEDEARAANPSLPR